MRTTDIGYPKNQKPGSGRRRHSVHQGEDGKWFTLCGKPASREYKGWVETVSCKKCSDALEEMEEK